MLFPHTSLPAITYIHIIPNCFPNYTLMANSNSCPRYVQKQHVRECYYFYCMKVIRRRWMVETRRHFSHFSKFYCQDISCVKMQKKHIHTEGVYEIHLEVWSQWATQRLINDPEEQPIISKKCWLCSVSERDVYNQWQRDWTAHREKEKGRNLGVDVAEKLEEEAGVMEGVEREPELMRRVRT